MINLLCGSFLTNRQIYEHSLKNFGRLKVGVGFQAQKVYVLRITTNSNTNYKFVLQVFKPLTSANSV